MRALKMTKAPVKVPYPQGQQACHHRLAAPGFLAEVSQVP